MLDVELQDNANWLYILLFWTYLFLLSASVLNNCSIAEFMVKNCITHNSTNQSHSEQSALR